MNHGAQLDLFSEINPHSVATVHNPLTGSSKVKVNKFNQIAMREFLESETHSKLQSETLNNLRNNLETEQQNGISQGSGRTLMLPPSSGPKRGDRSSSRSSGNSPLHARRRAFGIRLVR